MKLQQSRPLHLTETVVTIDEKELPAMMQRVPFLHQFFQQRDFLRAGFANAFLHAPTLDIFSPSGV
ncbi:MAG: hypothetical protein PUK20_01100 [Firmicutes bacterium]|nr:hypothetical protein [Bacillota bacterium]